MDRVDALDGRELLAHRNFVRSLARELVRDAATADDVAQETMARLLEVGRPSSIRPWLRSVARNFARRFSRRERRRAEIEGGRAPGSEAADRFAAPATDEIAARLELQRRLTERVLALEPRARDVVILHFYEGKSVAEVAEQLAIPLETARTRLRRALAELRAGWNGELGGERAGLAGLVLLARWTPAKGLVAAAGAGGAVAGSTLFWTGVVTMTSKVKVLIAAIVVVLAAGAVAIWPDKGVVNERHAKAPAAPPQVTESVSSPEPIAIARAPAVPIRREEESARAATVGSLVLLVHFARDHAPAAGVTMSVACAGRELHDVLCARTDPAGTVRFVGLPAGRVSVSSDRCDLGQRVVIRAGETSEFDFEIPLGLSITGVVVGPDGAPVPDALVDVTRMGTFGVDPQTLASTDENGRFDVRDAPTASLIGARAEGFTASRMKFTAGKAGNEAEVRLELGLGGGRVDGIVVGPDGKTVADAVVIVGAGATQGIAAGQNGAPPLPALTHSDADGRFHAVGIGAGRQPVAARARGLASFRGECEVAAGKTTALRVALTAGATVRGVVTDRSDRAVKSAEVHFGDWADFAFQRVIANDEGQFELVGLPAGEIEISAEQDESGRGSRRVVAIAGEVVACPIELSRGLELKGRVVDEKHAPVANVSIELESSPGAGFARTDEDGRFAMANCPEQGSVSLGLSGDGIEELHRSDVDPRRGELEIVVRRAPRDSVRIVGRVVAPDGRPVPNASVFALGTAPQTSFRSSPTSSDGRFEIGPFPPASWRLMVRADEFPIFLSDPHDAAANATWDLGTITLATGGWATFRVEGNRSGALFRLQGDTYGFWRELDETRDEGVLRSRSLVAGDYHLQICGERIAAQSIPFTIRAGAETAVSVRLQAGTRQRLEFALPEALHDPGGMVLRILRGSDLVYAWPLPVPQARSATEELWLSPGDYALTVKVAGHEGIAAFTVGSDERPAIRVELK